ncbi:MAG: GtrA family protein [Micrococcales bacterium]|nr:GtrA family protein [Micrococcales bacterium]
MPPPDHQRLRSHAVRLTKFGLTGGAGFVVDFGTLVVLHGVLRWPLVVATLGAYVLGGVVHYGLTRTWVFPHARDAGEVGKVVRYLLLGAANALVTVIAVAGLSRLGVDYRVAKVAAVVALFFTNYLLTPRFVMTTSRGSRTVAPESSDRSRKVR